MGLRAGIYLRVSKDIRHGRSVAEQESRGREDCAREGWEVAEVYVDNDRGASRYSRKARPDFVRLSDDIRAGALDVVVCWESSRLQRDLAAYVALRDLCREGGVLWSYKGRVFDLSRPDDRFQTGLDALLDEREVDVIRERIQRAVNSNAEKGRPHGKLLYGYKRIYDPETKELIKQVPREDQAEIVREMYARIAAGESCYAIAADLNDRDIDTPRNGRAWYMEQVREMLVNPAYQGKRVHQGRVIGDAIWAPLIDEMTWLTVHRILTDPARRTTRDRAIKHLLSGLAVCGVCGALLRVGDNRTYLAYMCSGKGSQGPRRFCTSIREEKLDTYVEDVVVERLSRPDALELLGVDTADAEARDAAVEVVRRRAELEEFYTLAAAGGLSAAGLMRAETGLLSLIAEAEARASRTLPAVVRDIARPDARQRWAELGMGQRRAVIRAIMRIRLLPVGRGRRTFDPTRVEIRWVGEG